MDDECTFKCYESRSQTLKYGGRLVKQTHPDVAELSALSRSRILKNDQQRQRFLDLLPPGVQLRRLLYRCDARRPEPE